MALKIHQKSVFVRDFLTNPTGGAHDAPPDPLVGWGGDTASHMEGVLSRVHRVKLDIHRTNTLISLISEANTMAAAFSMQN